MLRNYLPIYNHMGFSDFQRIAAKVFSAFINRAKIWMVIITINSNVVLRIFALKHPVSPSSERAMG